MSGGGRRLAAVLIADIAGYTRLVEQDTDATVAAWKAARADVIEPAIAANSGRIVKLTGDGFLAEFPAVQDAVQCSLDMQKQLITSSLNFRMGVNLGDVVDDGHDIHGEGVNIAARIEALAEEGGISISGDVFSQVRNRIDALYTDLGEHQVKHVSHPIRVYSVHHNDSDEKVPKPAQIPGNPSEKASIAILPFDNLSNDPEQEYFADGMTEDIMTALSKNRWLLVSARNSTFVYKGQTVSVRQVANDLGADFVLEGSVRKAGNRVRVSAQLIDASDGNHIWAERYDRDLDDIFEVQDEITATIAARIEPELGAAERVRVQRKAITSLDVWEKYHLGSSLMYQYTKEGNTEAQSLFREVIEADPSFPSAHAGLAYTLFLSSVYFGAEADQVVDEALREAETAVALDDKDANSYFILGRIHLIRREYDLSISDLRTAIDLNPCFATAYCGLGDSLSFSGRMAEAMPHFEEAIRLSPHDPRKWAFLVYGSLALMLLKRYEEAADWATRAIAVPNVTFWAYAQLTAVQSAAGNAELASAAADKLRQKEPQFSAGRFSKQFLFYHEDPTLIEHYRKILLDAGLPE